MDQPNPDQWYGSKTYSQHGEDIVFLNIFRLIGVEKITWLDCGAHHPFRISNTALLYEKGHRGINVEANPNLIEAFVEHRPEDKNMQIGVGEEPGELNFYLIDKWSGRNSFSKHSAVEFVRAHPEFKITEIIKIPVVTVRDILKQCGCEKFPDLLSLDVEGLDEKIILSLDLKDDGPKVICVEDNDRPDSSASPLRDHLAAQGYFPYYRAGVNILFVRNEYRSLLT
jgi:FkbM family methyltransferase